MTQLGARAEAANLDAERKAADRLLIAAIHAAGFGLALEKAGQRVFRLLRRVEP